MKSAKTALALLLLAAFVAFTDATTYQQCDPVTNSDCTYKYLPSCSGRGAPPSGTVYFTKEVDCCQCNDLAGSCYGCTSSLDCSYGSSTCGNLALTITIVAIVVPVVIISIIALVIICCCCCAAAAAASQGSHNTISGTTVIVTQPQPVAEVYVEAAPQYVQTNQTVELQPVGTDAYGQPVYQQQPPPPQYATYSY